MDGPVAYHGGTQRFFRRAETSANFGREIGLQSVHAHIRYVEAMAMPGRGADVWDGLLAILPILLERDVPNAMRRQGNACFSSSDAAFMDRYQATREWERVQTGEIGVKGGWRIYSSGPGIYLNPLVSHFLGVRAWYDDVLLDPVLRRDADGLTFDFEHAGRPVRYHYRVTGDGFSSREVRIDGRPVGEPRYAGNPYRRGGMLIPKRLFREALDRDSNQVEIDV